MPVYLLHGFRWPRPLVRIHIILQNLDDAAAEWLIAPPTTSTLLQNFHDLYPEIMSSLPSLRFYEQYDPNDISASAKSQPYAYVADIAEEIKLGAEVDAVRGKGVPNEQWAALMELRDKLAPEEKVSWFVVVCGDEERWAPNTMDLLQNGNPSPVVGNGRDSASPKYRGENGSIMTGSSVSRERGRFNTGRERSSSTRENGGAVSVMSDDSAATESVSNVFYLALNKCSGFPPAYRIVSPHCLVLFSMGPFSKSLIFHKLYDVHEEAEEDHNDFVIMNAVRRSVSIAYHLPSSFAGESAEFGDAAREPKRTPRSEKVLLFKEGIEGTKELKGSSGYGFKNKIPFKSSQSSSPSLTRSGIVGTA
ncbi:MAG: hypothetical protein M1820_001500 [Bogoriella megaspora]|nr:MAG: hypothetical protein M1820_001500 [Bogoriella megaspora]